MSQSFELRETAETGRDAVHRVLGSRRRQDVLAVLRTDGTPTDVETLARHVAERESPTDGSATEDLVESVSVELYHVHLPALDDVGLVAYDRDAEMITDVTDDVID